MGGLGLSSDLVNNLFYFGRVPLRAVKQGNRDMGLFIDALRVQAKIRIL